MTSLTPFALARDKFLKSLCRLRVTLWPCKDVDHEGELDRYNVSKILKDLRIPHQIWLEDVLAAYGSNAQAEHLSILVRDPSAAASSLRQAGFKSSPTPQIYVNDAKFSSMGSCVRHAKSNTHVMFYHDKDWYHHLEPGMYGMPPLAEFLDALMAMWLGMSSQEFGDRLAFSLHVSSLILHCYKLVDPLHGEVKSEDFAAHLRAEHRQLHFDIVVPPSKFHFATAPGHSYEVRRAHEIRKGLWEPRPHRDGQYQQQLATLDEQDDSSDHEPG